MQAQCDVLILSGNFGGGHNQLAAAISQAFASLRPELRVVTLDFTGTGSPSVSHFLERAYQDSSRWFPVGYSLFYWASDVSSVSRAMKAWSSKLLDAAMQEALRTYRPRLIVCTYPIPASVLDHLRALGVPTPPFISVITDAAVHNIWLNPSTDAYIVPSERLIPEMVARGVEQGRIYPLGLPLRPGFDAPVSPHKALPVRPRALLIGGAMGHVEFAEAVVSELYAVDAEVDVTIVTGRNERAYSRLTGRLVSMANVTILGYVDDMVNLMDRCDIVVTKPGGTSVFEAMSRGLPVIAYRPTWGQEEANARFLESTGAGRTCRSSRQAAEVLKEILADAAVFERMRAAALRHTKRHASHALVNMSDRWTK